VNWRSIFPWVFLFSCVDGFIANWLYPDRLALLYRDFLVLGVYLLFLSREPAGKWLGQLRSRLGPGSWVFALSFLVVGILQVFNPLSPGVLVGLLGLKVQFLYWPLALLAFAWIEDLEKARSLLKTIVYLSIPINLFGLYQFWQGPEFLTATFGPGFERAIVVAHIEGISAEESFLRVIGTFASSGQYSSFLLINAMFCFALMFSTRNMREWVFFGGCAVLNFLALLATGSRGALLVLLAQAVMYAVLCHRARRVLIVASLVGLSLYYGFDWMGEPVARRFESARDISMIRHRTVETTAAMFVNVLDEYPLGKGLGTASNATRHLLGEDSTGWELVENHLTKLQMETGIFGVFFFYGVVVLLILRWVRRWHQPMGASTFDLIAPIAAYCLTALLLSFVIGGFDSPPQSVFFWALVGMVAKLSALTRLAKQRAVALHQRAWLAHAHPGS
jgi:O-antigen ligase